MSFSLPWSWWKKKQRASKLQRTGHLHFVIYTRPGCHLCETAERCLRTEQKRWGFQMAIVNVDDDPRLAAEYGLQVPVVTVNGKVRFRGGIRPALLTRLLVAEAARGP
jgi:glutaredoxin